MVGLERKMAHNTLEPTRGRAHFCLDWQFQICFS